MSGHAKNLGFMVGAGDRSRLEPWLRVVVVQALKGDTCELQGMSACSMFTVSILVSMLG